MKKSKTVYLPCECAGGAKEYGYVGIVNFGDGIEIFLVKKKGQKPKTGIYIESKKSLKILRDLIKNV